MSNFSNLFGPTLEVFKRKPLGESLRNIVINLSLFVLGVYLLITQPALMSVFLVLWFISGFSLAFLFHRVFVFKMTEKSEKVTASVFLLFTLGVYLVILGLFQMRDEFNFKYVDLGIGNCALAALLSFFFVNLLMSFYLLGRFHQDKEYLSN